MQKFVRIMVYVVMAVSLMQGPVCADTHGSRQPQFTKSKFAVPINRDEVTADWVARGYAPSQVKPYAYGWLKGEHTHPVHIVITVVTGQMEFLIVDQRFVVEPGDELLYPSHAVHSARNLYEGTSLMLESHKP